MKKNLLLLIFFPAILFSQIKSANRKVVQIIEPRDIFVNSFTNINGKTRVDIKIDLPPNTIEWYYSFSTTPSTESSKSLDLLAQVSKLKDPSGITAEIINAVSVPNGYAPIDIFLMNLAGKNNFYKKGMFGKFEFDDPGSYQEGTAKNHRQGKIRVDDIKSGTLYLGIRNPSPNTGVNVSIEAVAIVEEISFDLSIWSKEQKENFYKTVKLYLSQSGVDKRIGSEKVDEYAVCVTKSLTANYKPNDFLNLASYESNSILMEIVKQCDRDMNTNIFKED